MQTIIVEIKSRHHLDLELKRFPELSSKRKMVQKGLDLVKRYLPAVLRYLSEQKVLARLRHYRIQIESAEPLTRSDINRLFSGWLRRKRIRRMFYMTCEVILMPLGAIFGLLPGPNVFFYSLFVLFYFHLQSFLHLRKIRPEELDIVIPESKSM